MKTLVKLTALAGLALYLANPGALPAFEGRITATLSRGSDVEHLLYTVGTNQLRIERGESDHPYPKDIVDLDHGAITLLFPHNRSFVRLKAGSENQSATPSGFPGMPNPPAMPGLPMPTGVGPQARPSGAIGPTNLPGMPAMPQMPQRPQMSPGVGLPGGSSVPNLPAMPMMPQMPMGRMELQAAGGTTNLLGYPCTRYELKQRDEVMEIWATDKLLPFQPYLPNQPHRFGPQLIEEQWGELLKSKRLFPLLAVLRFEAPAGPAAAAPAPPGPERMRFEVKSVTTEKIADDALFQPPPDYHEIQPLPF